MDNRTNVITLVLEGIPHEYQIQLYAVVLKFPRMHKSESELGVYLASHLFDSISPASASDGASWIMVSTSSEDNGAPISTSSHPASAADWDCLLSFCSMQKIAFLSQLPPRLMTCYPRSAPSPPQLQSETCTLSHLTVAPRTSHPRQFMISVSVFPEADKLSSSFWTLSTSAVEWVLLSVRSDSGIEGDLPSPILNSDFVGEGEVEGFESVDIIDGLPDLFSSPSFPTISVQC